MTFNCIVNKYNFVFLITFITIIGLIIRKTPVSVPNGFPYSAITIKTNQIEQKKKEIIVTFIDRTLEKGLDFFHQQGDENIAGIDETLGSGVCAADFNNDGWTDLFMVNGSGHTRYYGKRYWWQSSQGNKLYINNNGQSFKDATYDSGLDNSIWGMGCLASDFNNDGLSDLLVTGLDNQLLYKNIGNGKFVDVSKESGIVGKYWSTSAAAADFNGDGLLDIYVGNFIDFKKGKKTFEANSQFASEKKNTFDASLYEAQPNQLYQNLGGLKFKDVSANAGVIDLEGKTLDVSWQDINHDKRPDILITNDRGTGSNTSYLNRDGEHFDPVNQLAGLRSALGNRGISSGDLDNDGDIDLIIGSHSGESTVALINELPMSKNESASPQFIDKSREIGIASNQFLNLSAWSTIVQDFNNDGYEDIFIAAGQLEPDPDTFKVPQGQAKQLLINTGKGDFKDLTEFAGVTLQDLHSSRGSVSADFDNDGDADLFIVNNNDLGQYLVNESPKKHWLGLKLVGTKTNKDAIGAKVEIKTKNGNHLKVVKSGEGFLSDSDKRIVFGLGDATNIEQITVYWPTGRNQTVRAVKVDRYWVIEEDQEKVHELIFTPPVVNSSNHDLRLKLGVDKASIRSKYASVINKLLQNDQMWSELKTLALDNDPMVRLEVIKQATKLRSPQGLSLLTAGLQDNEFNNIIAAIEGLRLYEDEASIRWLLRLFLHQESAVRVALANYFAYLFQEEEAVVHRKYLAIPYLIRLLDDHEPVVRIAAARSLANAERFRGVHKLLDTIGDRDENVRAEIVRSLGLVRQGQSTPKLLRLLLDENQSAHVFSNIFIALKRLGDESALKTLTSFVMGEDGFDVISVQKRLDVFSDLLSQSDEVSVFSSEQLFGLANSAFNKFSPNSKQTDKNSDLLNRWIVIRQHFNDKSSIEWLKQQTRALDGVTRALAFKAVYAKPGSDHNTFIYRALHDKDSSITEWAVECLLRDNISLSLADYQSIIDNPVLRSIAIKFWFRQGLNVNPDLLIEALQSSMLKWTEIKEKKLSHSDFFKVNSGKIMEKNANEISTILEQICFSSNKALHEFCPIIVFAKNTRVNQDFARRLLVDTTLSFEVRESILSRYGLDFDDDAINILYLIAKSKKDPLRKLAIQKLFSLKSDALAEFAKNIAINTMEEDELRFDAVKFLLSQGHSEAQEILYQ